jgi:hypothetical protein
MFSHCKNPKCAAPFDYKKGRLYRFRQSASEKPLGTRSHGVKHFWLCDKCCKKFSLEYLEGEVLLLRRGTSKRIPVREHAPTLLTTSRDPEHLRGEVFLLQPAAKKP